MQAIGSHPQKFSAPFIPHDRSGTEAVDTTGAVYDPAASSDAVRAPDARFARIVPMSGDLLVEWGVGAAAPPAVGDGSTRLSGSAVEHMVPLPDGGGTLRIASASGTATFQISWVR